MKKVFFALFAVVIAVGGSAFTNAKVPAGTTYGGTSLTKYEVISIPYSNLDCSNTSTKTCAYQVTEAGEDIVTEQNYTAEQMATFLTDGYIVLAPGSRKGLYAPN